MVLLQLLEMMVKHMCKDQVRVIVSLIISGNTKKFIQLIALLHILI